MAKENFLDSFYKVNPDEDSKKKRGGLSGGGLERSTAIRHIP